jgi:hypothetical protein
VSYFTRDFPDGHTEMEKKLMRMGSALRALTTAKDLQHTQETLPIQEFSNPTLQRTRSVDSSIIDPEVVQCQTDFEKIRLRWISSWCVSPQTGIERRIQI